MSVLVRAVLGAVTARALLVDRRCREIARSLHAMPGCGQRMAAHTIKRLCHFQHSRINRAVRVVADHAVFGHRGMLIGPGSLLFLVTATAPLTHTDQRK